MANTALNRTTSLRLTNKSGGDLTQGAVVVLDSANASAFTTTVVSGYVGTQPMVIIEPNGIANNASGMVAELGYVPKINLSGSASLGDFVKCHTVAGQGVRHATPSVEGDFAQVLGTGTSPAAFLVGLNFGAGGAGTDTTAIHDNVSGEISVIAEKTTLVNDDLFLIEDSEAANAKKRVKKSNVGGGGAGSDTTAIHDDVSGEINAITEKVSLANDDVFVIEDSAASYAKKRVKKSNLGAGGTPSHSYFSYLCVLLEPDAIEIPQKSTFSYVVASNATKFLLMGWSLQIGGAGRIEVRDPRNPLPLRGVTIAGAESGSIAAFIDPTLPTYTDAWTTYYDRLLSIAQLVTKSVALTAVSTTYTFLPGPYGSIITQVTCFNATWIGPSTSWNPTAVFPVDIEQSDTGTDAMRLGHVLFLPVNKSIVAGVRMGAGIGGALGNVSYVILPSTWSKVTDPLTYTFRDDFMGASLDTATVWTRTESSAGNVEINTNFAWCKLQGNGAWGNNCAFKQTGYARADQKYLLVDVFTGGTGGFIVGWHDGAGNSYTDFAHGLHFDSAGTLTVYENSTSRGNVGSGWSINCIYRVRIRALSGGGASYEIQGGTQYNPIGSASWNTITPGTTTSATNTLHPGFAAFSTATSIPHIGDMRVY